MERYDTSLYVFFLTLKMFAFGVFSRAGLGPRAQNSRADSGAGAGGALPASLGLCGATSRAARRNCYAQRERVGSALCRDAVCALRKL